MFITASAGVLVALLLRDVGHSLSGKVTVSLTAGLAYAYVRWWLKKNEYVGTVLGRLHLPRVSLLHPKPKFLAFD
jgi:hypothetical protein